MIRLLPDHGLVFSGFPGAATAGGEGADGGHSRGPYPGCVDAVGRRAGQDALQGLLALSLPGIGSKASWPSMAWAGSRRRHRRPAGPPIRLPKARRPAGRRGVSRLCEEIDERVGAFLNRPLEGDWPYLWPPHAAGCMGTRRIDATYVKVRQIGRIVSVAVIIAVGVNTDGRREVLGMSIGASEAETFCTDFLRQLARRGLRGVKLVISDAHEGIKAAVSPPAPAGAVSFGDRIDRLLSRRSSQRPGSAAGCTSCATPWPTPARAVAASSPPSSPRRLRKMMLKPPVNSGAASPTNCAQTSIAWQGSWTRPSPTSSLT